MNKTNWTKYISTYIQDHKWEVYKEDPNLNLFLDDSGKERSFLMDHENLTSINSSYTLRRGIHLKICVAYKQLYSQLWKEIYYEIDTNIFDLFDRGHLYLNKDNILLSEWLQNHVSYIEECDLSHLEYFRDWVNQCKSFKKDLKVSLCDKINGLIKLISYNEKISELIQELELSLVSLEDAIDYKYNRELKKSEEIKFLFEKTEHKIQSLLKEGNIVIASFSEFTYVENKNDIIKIGKKNYEEDIDNYYHQELITRNSSKGLRKKPLINAKFSLLRFNDIISLLQLDNIVSKDEYDYISDILPLVKKIQESEHIVKVLNFLEECQLQSIVVVLAVHDSDFGIHNEIIQWNGKVYNIKFVNKLYFYNRLGFSLKLANKNSTEILKLKYTKKSIDPLILSKNVYKDYYKNIFQDFSYTFKNSIFLFVNDEPANILFSFKVMDINISTGMKKLQGYTSPLDYKIIIFLSNLFKDNKKSYQVIVNSFSRFSKLLNSKFKEDESVKEKILSFDIKNSQEISDLINVDSDNKELKKDEYSLNIKENIGNNIENSTFVNKKDYLRFKSNFNSLTNFTIRDIHTDSKNNSNLIKRKFSSLAIKENDTNNKGQESNFDFNSYLNFDNDKLRIYSEIAKIINNSSMSIEERQLKIEKFWYEFNFKKFKEEKISIPFLDSHMSILLKNLCETVHIEAKNGDLCKYFPNLYNYINENIEEFLFFSILTIHNKAVLNNNEAKGLNSTIGSFMLNKIAYVKFKELILIEKSNNTDNLDLSWFDPKKFYGQDILLHMFNITLENIGELEIRLGEYIIELLKSRPWKYLESKSKIIKEGKTYKTLTYYFFDSNLKNSLEKYLHIDPATIPMISKPKAWTCNNNGGYYFEKYSTQGVITGKDINKQGHKMENKKVLFNTINKLNSIEFSVNQELLEYLNTDESFKIKEYIFQSIVPKSSDFYQFIYTFYIAKIFSNNKFYLPTKADFRGRIYVNSFYLNYQGNDFNRALVNFYHGEPLNEEGKFMFFVYGASIYNINNMNKKSYKERYQWTEDNLDNILKMDFHWLVKAENLWLFVSFCLVMRKWVKNKDYKVKMAIYIDATCSGIQHLGGMIRDVELAKCVNLISNPDLDAINDIYSSVLENLNLSIEHSDMNTSLFPSDFRLSRKDIKRPVMTTTYNVSNYGMRDQVFAALQEKTALLISKDDKIKKEYEFLKNKIEKEEEELLKLKKGFKSRKIIVYETPEQIKKIFIFNYDELLKFVQTIREELFAKYENLRIIYGFLKDMCKVMNKLSLPIIWTTPSNIIITQKYSRYTSKRISICYSRGQKRLVIKDWSKDINNSEQINGIIPNIIHSLDASHLMEIINKTNKLGNSNVIPIHDCFGTHPNKINELYTIIKKEFVYIYSKQEFLKSFHKSNRDYIKNNNFKLKREKGKWLVYNEQNDKFLAELPSVPKTGDLDLKLIENSKYMFIFG